MKDLLGHLDLSHSDAVYLELYSDLNFEAEPSNCLLNCMVQAQRCGGALQHGWVIWQSKRGDFCEAELHVVWRNDGVLHDLTPRVDGERRVLFVPDDRHVSFFDRSANPPVTHTFSNATLDSGNFQAPTPISGPFVVRSQLPELLGPLP